MPIYLHYTQFNRKKIKKIIISRSFFDPKYISDFQITLACQNFEKFMIKVAKLKLFYFIGYFIVKIFCCNQI